nr:hypothetical protein [Gammaproteobacteria bacterium]
CGRSGRDWDSSAANEVWLVLEKCGAAEIEDGSEGDLGAGDHLNVTTKSKTTYFIITTIKRDLRMG